MGGDGGSTPNRKRLRTLVRTIDVRLPARIAMAVGAALVWLITFLVARAVHQDQWLASAASATAGWIALVVLVVVAAETYQIARHGPEIVATERETHNWPQPWMPPVILVAGVLLGWWLFK